MPKASLAQRLRNAARKANRDAWKPYYSSIVHAATVDAKKGRFSLVAFVPTEHSAIVATQLKQDGFECKTAFTPLCANHTNSSVTIRWEKPLPQ